MDFLVFKIYEMTVCDSTWNTKEERFLEEGNWLRSGGKYTSDDSWCNTTCIVTVHLESMHATSGYNTHLKRRPTLLNWDQPACIYSMIKYSGIRVAFVTMLVMWQENPHGLNWAVQTVLLKSNQQDHKIKEKISGCPHRTNGWVATIQDLDYIL